MTQVIPPPAPAQPPRRRYTPQEYFGLERAAERKHEYIDGQIIEMPGGTFEHNTISMNVGGALWNRLRGTQCRALSPDQQVRYGLGERYGYADVIVVCGEPAADPLDPSGCTLLNPVVVVEVLSPSTANYDRGVKRQRYQEIASLRHCVLVEQERPAVTVWSRAADGSWSSAEYAGLDVAVPLDAIGVTLPMAEIYSFIRF